MSSASRPRGRGDEEEARYNSDDRPRRGVARVLPTKCVKSNQRQVRTTEGNVSQARTAVPTR